MTAPPSLWTAGGFAISFGNPFPRNRGQAMSEHSERAAAIMRRCRERAITRVYELLHELREEVELKECRLVDPSVTVGLQMAIASIYFRTTTTESMPGSDVAAFAQFAAERMQAALEVAGEEWIRRQ